MQFNRGVTMRKTIKLKPLALILASFTLVSSPVFGGETGYIEPPMVSIPAGDFMMGSELGNDDEKPVRKVLVPAFQMGKYEVTIAEFRKFIEATDHKMSNQCTHRIGEKWLNTGPRDGSWNNNIYALSEFHPVLCTSRTDSINYAKWLSSETGKHYRLPTEAEWEYTTRAGTTTRNFFSDEKDSSKSCEFANTFDLHAKNMTFQLYNATYNTGRRINPCSDNEVIVAMVGLYQPNPFGVHDLIGNVVERTADCYQDSYEGAPLDASAVTKKNCTSFAARGGSWHWSAESSSQRFPMGNDSLVDTPPYAIEGFRLALDTDGKVLPSQQGNKAFIKALTKAQAKAKVLHKDNPTYPDKPNGLKITQSNNKQITLDWNKDGEDFVSGYRVYRQDPLTNKVVVLSNNVKDSYYVDTSPLTFNARYFVVALNGESESLSSDKVDSGILVAHILPTRIEGEAFSFAVGAEVVDSGMEPENDKIINSLGDKKAAYQIQVTKADKFQFDARVFHSGQTQKFELWLNDKKFANPTLDGERGWKTVENIEIELPQGTHTLTVKGEHPDFAVNWMDVKAVLSLINTI